MAAEIKAMSLNVTVNGLAFLLKRNDESKKWTFSEKAVTILPESIDKTLEGVVSILEFVKLLDKAATEVDALNVIANNFKQAV